MYALLANLFRVLSVGDLVMSSVNTNCPDPPPRSTTLAREYDKVIKRLFPALRTDCSATHQNNITTRLGKLAVVQNAQFEAQCMEKKEKATTSVTK